MITPISNESLELSLWCLSKSAVPISKFLNSFFRRIVSTVVRRLKRLKQDSLMCREQKRREEKRREEKKCYVLHSLYAMYGQNILHRHISIFFMDTIKRFSFGLVMTLFSSLNSHAYARTRIYKLEIRD